MAIKFNDSNLQPVSSEDARRLATYVWNAIVALPTHHHNKKTNVSDCDICVAKVHLINAFRMFRRFGE